ncbi:conjugal transfer protein TraH [Orientia tsutsugamushi]|uniref:conjugal transfer protein TraH n=1 Tax=Orientia tsutsugamushi TaxID=784 RepID=UPI000F659F77
MIITSSLKQQRRFGIPSNMRDSIMSMTGTIVVTNNNVHFYDSLAQDEKSWISHLKGGESASIYSCDNVSCLHSTLATKYHNITREILCR